jgi:hypothetical protein
MLTNVSSSIFANAQSIYMTPVVSAEWNNNLFTPPYITVAGNGTSINKSLTSGTVANAGSESKPNFTNTTKSFQTVNGTGSVTYTVSTAGGKAYKIVTYAKTNSVDTLLITASAKGTGNNTDKANQYGTSHEELDSLGWTKIITYIGVSDPSKTISSFTYSISSNSLNTTTADPIVYFTEPEIYETTYFDYRNSSLYPTESAFEYFRPGESYVASGDNRCSLPTEYRKINSSVISGYTADTYSPISPIIQNPEFFLASPPVPVFKTVLPSNIAQYRYFVSEETTTNDPAVFNPTSITGIYESAIRTNKLVIKFNALMTTPTVNIYINGSASPITVVSSTLPNTTTIKPDARGLIVLYWNGSSWTTDKWATTPRLNDAGSLSISTTVSKITVTQTTKENKTEFDSYTSTSVKKDLSRMQVIEISPRLEIDLTDLVESMDIDKSLDSGNSVLPISSLNTNDANIRFTGIPGDNQGSVVPIFSMQSTQSTTILANILRKNVKMYLGYLLSNYTYIAGSPTDSGVYIPGGVFYTDDWQENDMKSVSVQAYDVSRFLQTLQVSDYVANLKTVFEVITNLLDLSGFTDYDYDSLFQICNDKNYPMDLSYYYSNSQDTTVLDALNEIFMAYQIGAHIDEYGIMKFLSLKKMLSGEAASTFISDYNIVNGGYSSSVSAKPGKVSLRYQTPQIKQSPSLQNVKNSAIKNSPSFVITTSNDVVWSQETTDSVGFNYLNADMSEFANEYQLNVNDLLDIFHTYNVSSNGYVFIENEILSFDNKEFELSNSNLSSATITNAVGDGTKVTYTANNTFAVGDRVTVTNVNPAVYSLSGLVTDRTSTSFKLASAAIGTYVSGGSAVKPVPIVVKNNLELNAEISKFIKTYDAKLKVSFATITNAVGSGTNVVYTANNTFKVGDRVMVTAIDPQKYALAGVVTARTSTSFTIANTTTGTYVSGGEATIFADNDVDVRPTGLIKGVKRGLFGTYAQPHTRIKDNLASKSLSQGLISDTFVASTTTGKATIINNNAADSSLPSVDKIRVTRSGSDKTIIYPTTKRDEGYQTYSVKFDMPDQTSSAAGLFFNMAGTTDSDGAYFVEISRISKKNPATDDFYDTPRYQYLLSIYDSEGLMHAWSEVTGECNSIINNFAKIAKKDTSTKPATYSNVSDKVFNLKVVKNLTDGTDGENGTVADPKQSISVFINNIEIGSWMVQPGELSYLTCKAADIGNGGCDTIGECKPGGTGANCDPEPEEIEYLSWQPTKINNLTGMRQKPVVPDNMESGTVFGFFASVSPQEISTSPAIPYIQNIGNSTLYPASVREIHATKKALNERSVSYFYQDREFLNGIVQNQPLYSLSPTYMMQTTPEVSGINVYDIQYMTPAAVSVDILPIMYAMVYYPGEQPEDRSKYNIKYVYEDSLSYSTPINTGFRGIFAIANNSPHVVLLSKESTGTESVTVNLNLWTHEIVAPADPAILEVVIDSGNPSEVVQVDSEWIQSLDAARRLVRLIEKSIDGFSRTVSLNIFGNPLIQVGDIISLSYYLKGLSEQRYVVHSVSNTFNSGLETSLILKKL